MEPFTLTTATAKMIIGHGMIALFGALAHAINAHRIGKSKGVMDFLLLTIMSSFSGVIFALVALHLSGNEYTSLAAAGSGGFLGIEGLTLVAHKLRGALIDSLKKIT